MKTLVVLLVVLAFSFSAPTPKKLFHEHVEDFLNIINDEIEDKIDELYDQYEQHEEFRKTVNFIQTADFKTLFYEMQALPEFEAMIDFLENINIDVMYFIDLYNYILELMPSSTRQQISGKDFSSYIIDTTALYPKDKLSALFDQKMAEDEEFRTAIESLESEEWDSIINALWENETFKAEVEILRENGIDLNVLLRQLNAVFGQN